MCVYLKKYQTMSHNILICDTIGCKKQGCIIEVKPFIRDMEHVNQ